MLSDAHTTCPTDESGMAMIDKEINYYMKDPRSSNNSLVDGSTIRQGAENNRQHRAAKQSTVPSRLEHCTSYVFLSRDGCMMACSRANDLQASGRPFRFG